VNIDAIANKSRGDYAYTLIDTDAPVPAAVVDALKNSDAVIRVRLVK
jgi:D-3-phosphoglycerate dehydrogenase